MKAKQALDELESKVTKAKSLIGASEFLAVGELCRELLWVPQFEGAAELIAMMMVEEHPESLEARQVLMDVLVTLGQFELAEQIREGAPAPGVDEDDERVLSRLSERTRLAFESATRKPK